ncbi:tetratricopeptide repeat protein [Herpetosiphon giganteus]|uniref:tetratricopeptide repeat protein n=1 Tax=Herpetosiphon giganteus TaxID=2029754 RepID=UPI00195A851A|nr:tetratricopeptide repeat protein [Herpetosiphon giganteus]MBM7845016.1 tetratricopeptide (TPR) repeat protein [Herpetosiphon giganteus]
MTTTMWNERAVQDVLQRPERLLSHTDWRHTIQQHGGLSAFYQQLQQLPLEANQQAVLQVLTTYPGAPVDTYCSLLNVHKATYHRYQKALIHQLTSLLNGDQPLAAAPTTAPSLHQLRPILADFVGRSVELQQVSYALDVARTAARGAVISGIQGMGGVGKTELAIYLAHQLIPYFPDAQIVLNLYGSREQPLTVEQALGSVISQFQPNAKLPEQREQLIAKYAELLTGKRVLILADDARDLAHVQDLTPPTGNCLLVTSRLRFAMPLMAQVHLTELQEPDAVALLQQICPRLDGSMAEQLAAACGYLPLALRISASILAANPELAVAAYLAQLQDQQQQLAALEHPDDPQASVAASLALSYARLPSELQALARQVSVVVADFSSELGLATAGLTLNMANENLLYKLASHNLIQFEHRQERWRMHDLVRSVLRRYLNEAEAAQTHLQYAQTSVETLKTISDDYQKGGSAQIQSIEAFDREHAHIVVAWRWAQQQPISPITDQILVDAVFYSRKTSHIRVGRRFINLNEREQAVERALRIKELYKAGVLALTTANHYRQQGNYPLSLDWHERAYVIGLESQDMYLQSTTLGDMATCYIEMGGQPNLEKALELELEALRLFRESGHGGPIESLRVNNLGGCLNKLGRYAEAAHYYIESLTLAQQFANQEDECRALYNLGQTYLKLNQLDEAQMALDQALVIVERMNFDQGRAYMLQGQARLLVLKADCAQAIETWNNAYTLMHHFNHLNALDILWKIGLLYWKLGNLQEAESRMQAVLEQERPLGIDRVHQHEQQLHNLRTQQPFDDALLDAIIDE